MWTLMSVLALAGAPAVGEPFPPFEAVRLADDALDSLPHERVYTVVELVRSTDW